MAHSRDRLPITLFQLVDLMIVVASFGLAAVMIVHEQHRISLVEFLSMRTKISNVLIFLLILYMYHLVFSLFGLYRSRRLSSKLSEFVDVVKATSFAVGCFVLIAFGVFDRNRDMAISFALLGGQHDRSQRL